MMGRLLGALLWFVAALVAPADSASRKECKASACKPQITACKQDCSSLTRKKRARCRNKCKGRITKACRGGDQVCGDDGGGGPNGPGGPGAGQCTAYTSDCPAASIIDATLATPAICDLNFPSLPACTASFQTQLELTTPVKTTEGACCVIDTCAGATAFGVYNLLGASGLPDPPITAPVLATLDYQSSYFERPPGNVSDPGQWQFTTGSGATVGCMVNVPNLLGGAGFRYNYSSSDIAAPYATRPSTLPQASWLTPWALSADQTAVSMTSSQAAPVDIVRPGGGKPHMWDLDPLLFITQRNPPVEVLSESFSVDKVCRDEIIVSASGTFRRMDGTECSVTIYARASTRCDTTDQCLSPQQCVDGRCQDVGLGFDQIGR